MGLLVCSRAWRAIIIVCGLAGLGATDLRAEMLEPPASTAAARPSAEPFGLAAATLLGGGLRDKWLAVQHRLDDEMVQLALCEGDRDGCVSPAALKFLDIVDLARARDGRARLGEINRAVNLSIRARDDLAQHGQPDVWSSPLVTLERGGDCEDYAIAKFVALRQAGIEPDDVRIVIMHDTFFRNEDHAVAAARLGGRWLLLDNRRMTMILDSEVRNYRPTFVIGQHGVMRYADSFLLAAVAERKAPASLIENSGPIAPDLPSVSAN